VAKAINNGNTPTALNKPDPYDPDKSYFPPHVTSYILSLTDEFSSLAEALVINPESY